jgi:repressor LexA
MKTLTRRQQQILDFIQKWQQARGSMPSSQEITAQFGFRSPNAVTGHLRLMRKKGVIASEPGKARSLRVISPLAKLRSRIVDIPVLGVIAAGLPDEVEEAAEGCVSVDIKTVGFTPTRNTIAIRVSGVSMIGRNILDGDIVIVERGADARDGQIVVAHIDGKRTLKTLVIQGRKSFLKAENPKFPNLMPTESLVIEGVVKGLIRRLPN